MECLATKAIPGAPPSDAYSRSSQYDSNAPASWLEQHETHGEVHEESQLCPHCPRHNARGGSSTVGRRPSLDEVDKIPRKTRPSTGIQQRVKRRKQSPLGQWRIVRITSASTAGTYTQLYVGSSCFLVSPHVLQEVFSLHTTQLSPQDESMAETLLLILHHKLEALPSAISLEQLLHLSRLCSRLACAHIIRPHVQEWIFDIWSDVKPVLSTPTSREWIAWAEVMQRFGFDEGYPLFCHVRDVIAGSVRCAADRWLVGDELIESDCPDTADWCAEWRQSLSDRLLEALEKVQRQQWEELRTSRSTDYSRLGKMTSVILDMRIGSLETSLLTQIKQAGLQHDLVKNIDTILKEALYEM